MASRDAHAHINALKACTMLGAGRFDIFPGYASPIQTVRNAIARAFLDNTNEAGEAWSHLLFVDDDVIVAPNALDLLLEHDAGVVAGMVPSIFMNCDFVALNCRPEESPNVWYRRHPEGLVRICACGMACTLIRRDVFEAVGYPWFRWLETREGDIYGEDFDFCKRVADAGFTLWADGRVCCDHVKAIHLLALVADEGPLFADDRRLLKDKEKKRRVYTAV